MKTRFLFIVIGFFLVFSTETRGSIMKKDTLIPEVENVFGKKRLTKIYLNQGFYKVLEGRLLSLGDTSISFLVKRPQGMEGYMLEIPVREIETIKMSKKEFNYIGTALCFMGFSIGLGTQFAQPESDSFIDELSTELGKAFGLAVGLEFILIGLIMLSIKKKVRIKGDLNNYRQWILKMKKPRRKQQ